MTVHRLASWDSEVGPLVLRDAITDDAAGLAALHVQCWIETYSGLIDPQILAGLSVGDRTASWVRQIETLPESGRILLIEAGDELIGFGAIGAQRNGPLARQGYDGEISSLYLRIHCQGLGLGRLAFQALTASLHQRGFRDLALWVLAENRNAVGFYEHMGGRILTLSQAVPRLGGPQEIAIGWRDQFTREPDTNITSKAA